ncbi:MAG TPA: ferrous iron transport protein B [Abditibacteriaceae bacterium]|nr:ferrous iron transport protein B [Abditibacteriaceae bacterium]
MAILTPDSPPSEVATRRIALAGNPNAGKTTIFNALTGMRQKVGNYPGVTVEKKEGRCQLSDDTEAVILDLPGAYSLSPKSPDEEIARDVLLGLLPEIPVPDVVVVVVDASNLERNLYLATQILELGIPTVIALNMCDVAEGHGRSVDARQLSQELGAPVVELVAVRGDGMAQLRAALMSVVAPPRPPVLHLPAGIEAARARLAEGIQSTTSNDGASPGIALRLLCSNVSIPPVRERFGPLVADTLAALRDAGAGETSLPSAAAGAAETQVRYAMLGEVVQRVMRPEARRAVAHTFTDRADAILTHKVWGLLIFSLLTLLVFQAIYSWANYPMDLIDKSVAWLGTRTAALMPDGPLQDLLVHGIIAGVGAVIIFLPQIMVLFFFIGILEDTGYMARAAFLMDRMMGRVGLHGRAFIPLLSSFACAIPGIMATRTIASRRDRMTTILIAPLMSCSARLPVYMLMIGTFIPNQKVLGFLSLRATLMFSLYALGVLVAMAAAFVFKKTLLKGPSPALMLELPPYKIPAWRNVVITMWERGSQFLKRAGTVILAISILLWFLLNYPQAPAASPQAPAISPPSGIRPGPGAVPPIVNEPSTAPEAADEEQAAAERIRNSFGGWIGRAVEPFIAPLGFNWKIGIGLIGAMSAREVFVATMGTVYSVGDADEKSVPLQVAMQRDKWPDGRDVWTPLVAVSLLVYFVIAMQCISTLAIVKRETNSWRWPIFMQIYMTGLAWIASFIVYQGGKLLGWG